MLYKQLIYLSGVMLAICGQPALSGAQTSTLNMTDTTSQVSSASTELSITQALQIVTQQNPGLQEMQARAEAMAAIPSQAGTLPDPVVSFGLANLPTDSFHISQEPMTQWQFGISQQVPYPGKLALKETVAQQTADAALHNVDEYRQQLIRDIKTLWWRIFYLDKASGIVDINKNLLKQFIDIAQTKYTVGQGLQQDVLLAQLELSKLINRDIQLTSMRTQEVARLNALLNRPTDTAVKLPTLTEQDLQLPALQPQSTILSLAEHNRPALAQQRSLISAAETRKDLAEKDLLPDFNISAGYGLRQGMDMDGGQRSDFLSLRVGVNVPLFADRKQKMAISQRNSELKQQKFALQDKWASIQANISAAISRYHQAKQQQLLLQTGILPQARQTVASMLAGYQVNKVDFLNLIQAQITLYNYETNLWQVTSEAKSSLAELIASVGEDAIYE